MPEKYSRFRNSQNQRMLSGLFLETRPYTQVAEPLYTLRDWDHVRPNGDAYPSLYLKYMALEDLTEFEFANQYVDGWEHWQMLCQSEFFKPYIARWREELQLKIKSEAIKRLKEAAKLATGKNYVEINKYLANEGWRDKPSQGRGRPTKAQVDKAAKEAAYNKLDIEQDYERVLGIQTKPEGTA